MSDLPDEEIPYIEPPPGPEIDVLAPEEPPAPYDPRTEARASGYSWQEIDDFIAEATGTALNYGYSQPEVDSFLGYIDPFGFQSKARALWAGAMADDPTILDMIEPPAADLTLSPSFRGDYAEALLSGEIKGPRDFAESYAVAALEAAHDIHGAPPGSLQAVRDRQAQAAQAADALARELPEPEGLIDAAISLLSRDTIAPAIVGFLAGDEIVTGVADFLADDTIIPAAAEAYELVKRRLLDNWVETGQEPEAAAAQALADPELAAKLTAPPAIEDFLPSLATLTDPMVEFAKGLGGSLAGGAIAFARLTTNIEKFYADALGLGLFQRDAIAGLATLAEAEAKIATLTEPNRKDISTFIGRTLGGATGAIAEFATLGLYPTAALWAIHGADTAYRATGDLAAAALGGAMEGGAAFIPFHLLTGGGGIVQNAVKGVVAMGALGGVQAIAEPLPGLVAGHGYQTPTLAQIAEGVAGGAVAGSLFGVIGAVRPIRTYDPAKSVADAIRDVTPEQFIAEAAQRGPINEAAAKFALMEPAARETAIAEAYRPREGEAAKPGEPTPQEIRAQVEELIPAYEASHDMLRFLKGLSSDVLKDITGAVELYHGTGVVFAAEFGSPFGRFKLEKVGAGEGAQLFSWGLYFAQDPKIAGWYKDADLRRKGTEEGALFTVKVDVEPRQLLDWDIPLREQPAEVQAATRKALGEWATAHADAIDGMTGEALFKRLMQEKGATVAETTAMTGAANKAASLALLAEGVRGMRYGDASTRGLPPDQRSFNHVIYDPAVIKITHRNGDPVPNTLFSLLMPLLEGPVNRVGSAVDAITAKYPLRFPEQIVQHHLNQAAKQDVQRSIIAESGRGERTLANFAERLEGFHKDLSPHISAWELALRTKDPAKLNNTVIGNLIAYVEGRSSGAELGESKLLPLADMMRIVNMEMYKKLEAAAADGTISRASFIEDYFRHLWKDPRGPAWEALRGAGVGRTGSAQGLLERTIPTTAEGLARGLTPKIADPIDLMLYDLGQKVRYLHAREIIAFGKEQGYIYYGARRSPNDIQLTASSVGTKDGGIIHAWAPAGFAKSYNNWLDAGLYGHPSTATTYEKLLWMTNTMTGMKLAFPTFHSVTVGVASWSTSFGRGLEEIARGQFGRAALDWGTAATVFGPIAVDAVAGTRALRTYVKQANDPVLSYVTDAGLLIRERPQIVSYLTDVGLRFGPRQSVYRYGPESFQKSASRGTAVDLPIVGGIFTPGGMREIFRALGKDLADIKGDPVLETGLRRILRVPDRVLQWPIKALGRVMNTITDPLFDHAIPALKVGAAYRQLESWMAANKTASPEAVAARAREIVKEVDNRYGELNQDTLFWRRAVKQTANVTMISTGWVYGTYRGFLGALGFNIETGRFQWNPTVTVNTLGMVAGFSYANSILQYLHTGTFPWQTDTPWTDALAFRSGGISKYGTPERGMIPSEMKEMFDLYKVVKTAMGAGSYSMLGEAFTDYALAKVNPFWQVLRAVITGEDGIGHRIANTPEGWMGFLRSMFSPIVIEQLTQRRVGSNITTPEILMGLREQARYIEDPEGYAEWLGKRSERWSKEELARARREAIERGAEPPAGSQPSRRELGGGVSGGGAVRSPYTDPRNQLLGGRPAGRGGGNAPRRRGVTTRQEGGVSVSRGGR